jgi:predicted DsbA family dithiol-disulfide isomerase
MSAARDRVISVALTAAIVLMAAVLVHREFFAGPPEPDPPTLEFVSDWKSAVDVATLMGPPNAKIIVVEFADLQCPACRAYHRTLQRVQDKFGDDMTVAFVHLPLPYHKAALLAARGAECARAQGRFGEFVAAAYQRQDSLGKRPWSAYAADAGISDRGAFERCQADTTRMEPMWNGLAMATQMSVTATPTLIVNGWRFSSVPTEKALVRFIKDLLAGRTPDGPTRVTQAVLPIRDASGAQTVLRHGSEAFERAPQMRLDTVAAAVIGRASDDGEYDLSNATQFATLDDGRLVAFSMFSQQLLLFGPSGAGQRIVLRHGTGPQGLSQAWNVTKLQGDTLALMDGATERLIYATPEAGIVRTIDLRGRRPTKANLVAGAMPNGDVILYQAGRVQPTQSDGIVRTKASVLRLTAGGAISEIAVVPDLEVTQQATQYFGKPGRSTELLDFTRRGHVQVWDSSLVTASGDGYSFDVRGGAGQLLSRVVVGRPRRMVTAMMRDSMRTQRLAWKTTPGAQQPVDPTETERLARSHPTADSLPPYDAFYAGPGGILWVVEAPAPGDSLWWGTGFRKDGAIVGRVRGPSHYPPLAFTKNGVVVKRQDADGVVTVTVHRMVPVAR